MTTLESCPVIPFDHHGVECSRDRAAVLERVSPHPLFYTDAHGGFWVVTSVELAQLVLRDSTNFGTARQPDGTGGITIPQVPMELIPAELDPPQHTVFRNILAPLFSRGANRELTPVVEEIARTTLAECVNRGSFDVVMDIGHVFPATIILRYLGFPEEDRLPLIRAIQRGFGTLKPEGDVLCEEEAAEAAFVAFGEIAEKIYSLIQQRREAPADDILTRLVNEPALVENEEALFWTILTLVVGGTENVAATIENGMFYLSQDVDLRKRLIAEPELIPAAVEEFLRVFSPGVSTVRHARADVELGGVSLQKGARVLVWLPAVNHDPATFENPTVLDVDRPNANRHLAFGAGTHRCVGSMLGQLELQVFFRELLNAMPDYTIDAARSERFADAAIMYGWWSMPGTVAG